MCAAQAQMPLPRSRTAVCCEHLSDPELKTLLSHAEAGRKTVEVYVWQGGERNFVKAPSQPPRQPAAEAGGVALANPPVVVPNLQAVLAEIGNCPEKNPSHPQEGKFKCAVLVVMVALFILLIIGMQNSGEDKDRPRNQGDDNQSFAFVIFWFVLVILFLLCFVQRVVYRLKEYTYKRHEIFRDIFRRHLYPGVEYRLSRRGFVMVVVLDPTVRGGMPHEHSENLAFNVGGQAGGPHRFALNNNLNRSVEMQREPIIRPPINMGEAGAKVPLQPSAPKQDPVQFDEEDKEPTTP